MSHALLAPSSAEATEQCPGSVKLRAQFPDESDDTAAREGEAAHWTMAQVMRGVVWQIGGKAPNGVVITKEMSDAGLLVREDVELVFGPHWIRHVHVEETLPAGFLHPENWGTPDVWGIAPDGTLCIWDLKFGYGIVEVYKNRQLLNYAALIRKERRGPVRLCIVQPRAFHPDGPVRVWNTELSLWEQSIYQPLMIAFTEALGPNPRLRTGEACEYCSARRACPALTRAGYRAADYSKMEQPFDLPPEALGRELELLDRALTVLDARRSGLAEQALRFIRNGTQIDGWGLERGRGKVDWTVTDAQVINTGAMFGLNLAKPVKAFTPKQAKEAGLDPDIVQKWSTSYPGEAKLARINGSKAALVFGAIDSPVSNV